MSNNNDTPPFGSSFFLSLHQRVKLSTFAKFAASSCWCHQYARWSKNLLLLQLVVSPSLEYELFLVPGDEKLYVLLLLSAPSFIGDWSFP